MSSHSSLLAPICSLSHCCALFSTINSHTQFINHQVILFLFVSVSKVTTMCNANTTVLLVPSLCTIPCYYCAFSCASFVHVFTIFQFFLLPLSGLSKLTALLNFLSSVRCISNLICPAGAVLNRSGDNARLSNGDAGLLDGGEETFNVRGWIGDSDVRAANGDELRLGDFWCDGETEGDGVLARGDSGACVEDLRLLNCLE